MIFRFDDVSINTEGAKLFHMIDLILTSEPGAVILLAFSPIVFSSNQLGPKQEERVHPSRLTAMSSLTPYYEGHRCGLPDWLREELWENPRVIFAGHGLVHVDHRLLTATAQEMSIVTSAQLARGPRVQPLWFVPPYNKWDVNTQFICQTHGIEFARFEDGWEHMLFNDYNPDRCQRYYMHPFDMSVARLESWFENEPLPIVTTAAPIREDQR